MQMQMNFASTTEVIYDKVVREYYVGPELQ